MQVASDQLDVLRTFDTGTVANAIDHLGIRPLTAGFASLELRCLFPEYPSVVGFAVTCREDTTTPRPGSTFSFADVYRLVDGNTGPTIVVCQDVGLARSRSCHLGDMMATVMSGLGATGFVTDGGVRDLAGLRQNAPGFQVFAAGTVAGAGEATVVDVGSPVSICGLIIQPGDLLVGDASGLVSVPLDALPSVIKEASAILEREKGLVEFVRGDAFTLDAYLSRRK